jgi:hypothetical protein
MTTIVTGKHLVADRQELQGSGIPATFRCSERKPAALIKTRSKVQRRFF